MNELSDEAITRYILKRKDFLQKVSGEKNKALQAEVDQLQNQVTGTNSRKEKKRQKVMIHKLSK